MSPDLTPGAPMTISHDYLILEHPNFQRRKVISRTDPVIPFLNL